MPTSIEGILFVFGGLFLMIGIVGGGLEVSSAKIPAVSKAGRVTSFLLGLVFLGVALWSLGARQEPAPTVQSTSPIADTAKVATRPELVRTESSTPSGATGQFAPSTAPDSQQSKQAAPADTVLPVKTEPTAEPVRIVTSAAVTATSPPPTPPCGHPGPVFTSPPDHSPQPKAFDVEFSLSNPCKVAIVNLHYGCKSWPGWPTWDFLYAWRKPETDVAGGDIDLSRHVAVPKATGECQLHAVVYFSDGNHTEQYLAFQTP